MRRIIPALAGNTSRTSRRSPIHRIIPALAGNTSSLLPPRRMRTDHPRAGGEHLGWRRTAYQRHRIIPALAGNTLSKIVCVVLVRIIPALAGNTHAHGGNNGPSPDHPRAGGEHWIVGFTSGCYVGSSVSGAPTPSGFQREIGVKTQGSS